MKKVLKMVGKVLGWVVLVVVVLLFAWAQRRFQRARLL